MYNDEIFPNDSGCIYEKYISLEPDDHDVGDSPSDHAPEDLDSEVYPSEDDSDSMEATAQFDFIARFDRELSLEKGDSVTLYSQVSSVWWRGVVNGNEGLIPDKHISLKMKNSMNSVTSNVNKFNTRQIPEEISTGHRPRKPTNSNYVLPPPPTFKPWTESCIVL